MLCRLWDCASTTAYASWHASLYTLQFNANILLYTLQNVFRTSWGAVYCATQYTAPSRLRGVAWRCLEHQPFSIKQAPGTAKDTLEGSCTLRVSDSSCSPQQQALNTPSWGRAAQKCFMGQVLQPQLYHRRHLQASEFARASLQADVGMMSWHDPAPLHCVILEAHTSYRGRGLSACT